VNRWIEILPKGNYTSLPVKTDQSIQSLTRANQGIRLAAALGLVSAIYLTWHYRLFLYGAGDQAGCNVNEFINCDNIAASSWSKLIGIPLSVWGAGGYLALIVHTSWALASRDLKARSAATLLLILPFAVGLVALPLISFLSVHALCLGCMVSWVADVGLVVFGVKLLREEMKQRQWQLSFQSFLPTAAVSGVVIALLAWFAQAPAGRTVNRNDVSKRISNAANVEWFNDLTVTDSLTPVLGGAKAPVTIVYFTDLQCPYCKQQTQALKELVRRRGREVRVIYRHFPLDASCNSQMKGRGAHQFACTLARVAIAAQRRGVFASWSEEMWKEQEKLTAERIRELSLKYGLDDRSLAGDSQVNNHLLKDIELGARANVPSTPTTVINGKVFAGYQPLDRLETIISILLTQR
jgi:protein-disulfide isomerase/uncharacterized membrane protein